MGKRRGRRRRAYWLGIFLSASLGLAFFTTPALSLRRPGPMNTGHGDLACPACHRSAPGTLRQQIQANVGFLLGTRPQPANLVLLPVGNAVCWSCHRRPNDRHPVFRFREPRFVRARQDIAAHRCTSCHTEHRGVRVTQSQDFCQTCHTELEISADPIVPSHRERVMQRDWQTCLGCHDFHGNHRYESPTETHAAVSLAARVRYFAGGPSPYGEEREYVATKRPAP